MSLARDQGIEPCKAGFGIQPGHLPVSLVLTWNRRESNPAPAPATCGPECCRNQLGPVLSPPILKWVLSGESYYSARERIPRHALRKTYATTFGTTGLVGFRDRSLRPWTSWCGPSLQEPHPHERAKGPRPRRTRGRSGRCYAWRPSHPCSERKCPPRYSP